MTQTWLITGSNRGIGLELARQVQARGDAVIGTCRDPDSATGLQELGITAEELDVASGHSVLSLAEKLEGTPIDVLVNNAGIGGGNRGLPDLEFELLIECFETNSVGPLRVTSALLPNLRAGQRRVVANLTSRMGSVADNTSGGYYAYRMSKAALNMANRSMAHELGEARIISVVFHPGWVQTDMGGEHAPLPVEQSVRGLLEVIDKLTLEDSGGFFDHAGETIPW